MRIEESLKELGEDRGTDLYKALQWAKNTMSRGERKFTLPAFEFKSASTLHDQLVILGYRAMIYTEVVSGVRKIVVWW